MSADTESFKDAVREACLGLGLHFEPGSGGDNYAEWVVGRVSDRDTGASTTICFTALELIQNEAEGLLPALIATRLKNADRIIKNLNAEKESRP